MFWLPLTALASPRIVLALPLRALNEPVIEF